MDEQIYIGMTKLSVTQARTANMENRSLSKNLKYARTLYGFRTQKLINTARVWYCSILNKTFTKNVHKQATQ